MKGFCDKAVLVMMKPESFDSKLSGYQMSVQQAAIALIAYLNTQDISVGAFNTDEVATNLLMDKVNWISACTPEDEHFAKINCGMFNIPAGEQLVDLYKKARNKFIVPRGLAVEQRFSIVEKKGEVCCKHLYSAIEICYIICSEEQFLL